MRDLPLVLAFETDLLGVLAIFLTVLEGVVLRYERVAVCFVVLYRVLFFLVPRSSLSREFLFGETFAGFDFGSLNFLSELFFVVGTAVIGLARPKFVERGMTGALTLAEWLMLAVLFDLPARRSSSEISFTDFLI